MNTEEIFEGNKLMFEFMEYDGQCEEWCGCNRLDLNQFLSGEQTVPFQPDKSWDDLMQVVEKIESIHDDHHGYFGVHIHSNCCDIQGTNLHRSLTDKYYGGVYMSDPNAILSTKKESTWHNVVEFIKWYNNEKLKEAIKP